jgi:preprotein translocase subunit SecF
MNLPEPDWDIDNSEIIGHLHPITTNAYISAKTEKKLYLSYTYCHDILCSPSGFNILKEDYQYYWVKFTAAGIAGFILSIGMAVDANVLIFERMKEELKRGKSVNDALHEGFSRAWLSIRDSNISSIITAIILFWLGTSAIKGFALTLGLGVVVSMFTAITVSRTFLFAIAPKGNGQGKLSKFLFSNGLHFK